MLGPDCLATEVEKQLYDEGIAEEERGAARETEAGRGAEDRRRLREGTRSCLEAERRERLTADMIDLWRRRTRRRQLRMDREWDE